MFNFERKALVFADGDLIFYYTGFFVEDGYLIILGDKKYLLTDGRYIEHAKIKTDADCRLLVEYPLVEFLKSKNVETVGIYFNYSSANLYKTLISYGFNVYDCESEYQNLSKIKSESELAKIKKACEITETALVKTLPYIKEGVSELDVSCELEYNFKKLGGKVGFDTIVAFGKNSSVPHYQTSNVKLQPNSPVLIDFGACYGGYLADMTRTLFFGEPNKKFLSVYEAVKTAHLKAVNELRAGMLACEVDLISRSFLKQSGLDKYFLHSLGHGVGVKIHEFPTLSKKSSVKIENGMVFTVEPGVYLEGEFGVRIEDTVTVRNGKCVSLMTLDKEPIIINR